MSCPIKFNFCLGGKSIDTKEKTVGPEITEAVFNEKFQMKTAIDWDSLRGKFGKKKSILAVFTKDRSKMLGEADFDLGKYANDPSKTKDQLPLRNCESDPKAFIEIYIKAKMLEDKDKTTPRGTKAGLNREVSALPSIEEKNSDFEVKEEFERLEIEYLKTISRLEVGL